MTYTTLKSLFRLSAAWVVLALTACAHAVPPALKLEQFAWYSTPGSPRDPHARSVALLVINQCSDSITIHVLRAGSKSARLGVVAAKRSRLFDVTSVAPVGAKVRFAGDRFGMVSFVSDEVRIRRPGTILVEVEPEGLARNVSQCDAPTHKPSRRASNVIM